MAQDIKAQVVAEEHEKHNTELEKIKIQAEKAANDQLAAKLELAEQKKNQELDLEREKIKAEFEGKSKKELQERELAMKQLTNDAETEKADNKKLREQLSEMMDQLREEKKSRENVELEAKKKLSEEEDKIREDAKKKADEEHRLKNLEMEKKLRDTQEALATAQRKAEQGSQQNQGEVLELDLEESLRQEFPLDEIKEVKKGVRGADVTQIVKNNHLEQCGIMLYESKNAAWQPKWIAKFKEDIREAGASIGVLVSKEIPADYGDLNDLSFLFDEIDYSIESALDQVEQNKAKQRMYFDAGVDSMVTPKFTTGMQLNLNDLSFLFDEIDYSIESALDQVEQNKAKQRMYFDAGVDSMVTPKFTTGMQLIEQLVAEGKKVIVWGMFVGTMHKIYNELKEKGILSHLIYGQTPKEDRVELINQFRSGPVQVLISNPATLGESISLHQSVHDAVYFEYNFNLTFMLQSRDRIHRLGLADDQYTRYYYLMTEGNKAHDGFIDRLVYNRLKEKEAVMMNAIEGNLLLPEVGDDYLEDVKKIITKITV